MGVFHIVGEVEGIRGKGSRVVSVGKKLVDTGSELSWIPEPMLVKAGVQIVKKDIPLQLANGTIITRSVGYAIIRAQDFETVDEVIFGQPGDCVHLGARTLEGFGVMADPRHKKLVASSHLAARNKPELKS